MKNKEFETPVMLAKEWAELNLEMDNGDFSIQYHAVKIEGGFVVYLDHIYPEKDVLDDDWCIFINDKDQIERAEQCLSP